MTMIGVPWQNLYYTLSNNPYVSNRTKYYASTMGLPYVSDMARAEDNVRYMEDYLRNRGMTWADVKYPTRMASGNLTNGMLGSTYTTGTVIQALYDIDKPIPKLDQWNPMFG